MVAYGRSLDSRTEVGGARSYGVTSQEVPPSRLPVSVIALIAAIGVFVASAAYAAGRLGNDSSAWPNRAYWLGQALVLIPIAWRLLSRRALSNGETVALIVILTVAEYLLKVCYSPLGFTFADEFLHWRGTANLLQTGNLFAVNYGLPIGPHYPGIEEATTALISATGISIFSAGLIVSGLAHLLFICLLYLTFRAVTRSHRIAGIAIVIYFSTPDLTSFNSMFVYETLALTFLGLAVFAGLKAATEKTRSERTQWFVIAVLAIFATVVTHHVTSYMLTGALILVAIASALTHSRYTASRLGALAAISLAAVVCWIAFVARDTINYFSPTVQGVVKGFTSLLSNGSSAAPSTSTSPLGDQVLEGIDILVILALLALGGWQVWRRYRRHPLIVAMTLGSLGWFGVLAVRVGTANGQELAGRSATYVDIPVCVITALAITKLVNSAARRRRETAAVVAVTAGVLILLFDGLANGWPPYWERLPGPHQVAGFERSVGPQEIATADWTLSHLGPGNRMAADIGIFTVLAGYGNQNTLQDVAYLYTSPTYTAAIGQSAAAQDVQYVQVDQRLSQSLPVSGGYFPGDGNTYSHPLSSADLTKFNHVQGVARVYDSGDIVIYNLQGLGYVPVP
jgi:hypothetical protein